ncbi:MAG TPA: hypothetical protein VFG87_05780 [Amycolatopsis sp.]|nr:hypothetical protein [Amycolatopsis sp.]
MLRRGLAVTGGVLVLVVGLVVGLIVLFVVKPGSVPPPPGCTAQPDGTATNTTNTTNEFGFTTEQTQNAATIAAVGIQLGMPAHAVTIALATAMQESKLRDLSGGDRDSAGLFQQRPSQGWGTYAQVTDPIHASAAFYDRLKAQPGWLDLSVTQAAQLVQHSATPDAYAQWETAARTLAAALTGETAAGLSCQNLTLTAPSANLVTTAENELGTATLTGTHPTGRGWAMAAWLVANATRFAIDQVTFDGRTWTATSGTWSATGSADGMLTFHQTSPATPTSAPSS